MESSKHHPDGGNAKIYKNLLLQGKNSVEFTEETSKRECNFRLQQQRIGGIIQLRAATNIQPALCSAHSVAQWQWQWQQQQAAVVVCCNKRFVARRKDNHTFNRDLSLLQATVLVAQGGQTDKLIDSK
ncbi:unnamed protein product [Ceratitis capitata]|uniref:(Mediterranean fruit fly) hypothetical protein n=1 Tax=Ceratitis capitata TaxID=7213 RepID=A0A811V1E7_CERCA|nr:unnamed protein product [Ceratitis capitata]